MNINIIEIKNEVFKTTVNPWKTKQFVNHTASIVNNDVNTVVDTLRNSKDIIEKQYGDISSFNFTKNVFYSGKWNDLSKFARGLFINTATNEIIARGYEKFFNYNEGQFNQPAFLKNNLKFPVTAYNKYNGFLGLLGIDDSRHAEEKLVFCSKSSPTSDFAKYFYDIFYNNVTCNSVDKQHDYLIYANKLSTFMLANNLCLIFEVIDPINDPHIVKYDNAHIVLLGAIKRTVNFEEVSFSELQMIAKDFGFICKECAKTFNTWEELEQFIDETKNENMKHIEGFVLEDMDHYMFKLKVKWYKIWKNLRTVKDKIAKGNTFKLGFAQTPEENLFIGWCKNLKSEILLNNNIITLREMFYNQRFN